MIMGGSWYSTSERKVRSLFKVSVINNEPGVNTNNICKRLIFHLEHNEGFTVNSGVEDGYTITLLNENTFSGDKYSSSFTDFETLERRIQTKFYYHLLDLAMKYVESKVN